jgi:hypothetical protein
MEYDTRGRDRWKGINSRGKLWNVDGIIGRISQIPLAGIVFGVNAANFMPAKSRLMTALPL